MIVIFLLPTFAPHAGAWIETEIEQLLSKASGGFAPHAGAWIETYDWFEEESTCPFAPHAGAWIETNNTATYDLKTLVCPSCGGVD